MALISSAIPNLINGVTQQPPSLRLSTQAELQENALSSVVQGLVKRPASQHIANIGSISGAGSAFIHTMRRDENEYYNLIITTDAVRIFDKEGVERTITGDASYLAGLTNPAEELAATTVADYTFLLNKSVTTAKDVTLSPSRPFEGLVYVKQGGYRLKYVVKITKGGSTYTRTIETMASTQASAGLTDNAERSIQTDRIATNLNFEAATDATYYGSTAAGTLPNMTVTQYGNVLHYQSTDNVDFTLEVEDSRGNQNIFGFKGAASDFDKLPPAGPDEFVIKIIGDNDKGQDDYFVRLSSDESGAQIWREDVEPNVEIAIDPLTMPHQLVSQNDGSFVLQAAAYRPRKVGSDDTNPFPSFIGLPLADIFFHRNRLGVLADENVIFAEAGNFTEFNFFLKTTLSLLDSDVIDLAVSNNKVSILKHAVPFNQSLLLFSDLTQFKLDALDLLTPSTARVDVATQFEASLRSKPVGAGRYVFFATKRGKWAGVREYFVEGESETTDAADITAHCPEYLQGEITKLEASSNEDTLLALCSDDPNAIYVYRYYWQGTEKLQSSWSRWTFDGAVLNASFNNSNIDLLVQRDDALCLERINLSTDDAILTNGYPLHLDRRVLLTPASPALPYTEAAVIYITTAGEVVSEATKDVLIGEGASVYAGILFVERYIFSPFMFKSDRDVITTGRLQLRRVAVVYNETGTFEARVTPTARETKVANFTGRIVGNISNILDSTALESGTFKFYIMSSADEVEIELRSESYLPCAFQSAEWEGYYTLRSRRI